MLLIIILKYINQLKNNFKINIFIYYNATYYFIINCRNIWRFQIKKLCS